MVRDPYNPTTWKTLENEGKSLPKVYQQRIMIDGVLKTF